MNGHPILKRPKIEEANKEEEEEEKEDEVLHKEQEEALVALTEHRTKEVDHIRQRISFYNSQLHEAEKRLEDTQSKLVRHRGRGVTLASKPLRNCISEVKVERSSSTPVQAHEASSQNHSQRIEQHLGQDDINSSRENLKVAKGSPSPLSNTRVSSQNQSQARPQLVIPAVAPNVPQPPKVRESGNKVSSGSGSQLSASTPPRINSVTKLKGNQTGRISSEQEETQQKGTKRKIDQVEHKDVIQLISSCTSPHIIHCQSGCFIHSHHKRKLRNLELCPTNDQLFVTSALDGAVNLWQVQGKGSGASRLSTTDCLSDKGRRWPEDVAWHPEGNKLFSVYSADGGDSQVSVLNLNKGKERARVSFLPDKPHVKGLINSIMFMPWDDTSFITGGSDHAVILWTEKDGEDSWKYKALHRSTHSSAVNCVAGMRHKKVVMSVGADKRINGYDVLAGRSDYKHQLDSKCMSIVPNPCDFNLFMVQTGTPEKQLRLFDLRVRQMELHSFGWKQENSESQSALINQAWSPNGLYITSGSADPCIHIFDIRYNAHKPSQSVKAHEKRVFKAAWHHALPLLISISSDYNVGLHKVVSY